LRRSGRYAPLAQRLEYIAIPAGEARLALLGSATEKDTLLRQLARLELQRQISESPFNARAHSMIANLDIAQGDFASARHRLEEALRQDPLTFAAHERLGMMAMAAGRAREALEEFQLERRLTGGTPELPQRLAQARAVARGGVGPPRPGG
jgi:predicted Zn-dependent protease